MKMEQEETRRFVEMQMVGATEEDAGRRSS